MSVCRQCHQRLRIVPVVLIHDHGEKRRFEAIFSPELVATN